MALFKILKGQGANLPSGKVEGYAYVTTDTHKFYVDISASERIELNAFAADRLSNLGTAHQALVGKASDDAISANPVWRDVSPSVNITNGTAAGPTVKITVLGEDSLATAFPTATAARSGVVNVGDQVFFGNKKFQMKDTIELRTGDKPYWINKNLDWEATSYKRWVILLVPELTASNQVVNNFLEGKFCFYKLGGNLLDAVDLTLNVCYNEIKYYLQNFGDNATFNLCRVVYNNIAYIALNVGYQSNPYSSVSFTGHVYSTLDGGNEGANFPLNLPFAVNYRTEAHDSTAEIINNAEVNSSITDTLTTSLITNVTRYNLKFYADGANITNLNASNLMNGTVPIERIPSLPTSKITSGVLPVARGGTGVGSWTVNQVVLTNASDGTGAFTSRGYKDSTSAEAIGTTSDFVTERDIYYGLPKINNSHAYTSAIGIYAPNGHGNASSALMGNDSDAAPTWVAVAPAAAFANGTDSAGPSLTITVLGLTSTGVVIPKGSKDVYGVLKLTEGYTSTDGSLAATGKSIKAAIDQLDVAEVGGSGKYISAIKEVDGKISATVTSTSVSNSWANGTSAGPSITTTVNGVAATAAVIPSASASYSGVVTTGAQTFEGEKTFNKNIIFADANVGVRRVGRSVNWVDGRDSAVIATTSINGYGALASIKTTNGSWEIGAYNHSSYTDDLLFNYCTDVDHASATYNNRTTAQIKFLENGHIVAALDGNASSATKLATPRAINGTNFDGTAAITTANWGTARTITIGGTGKSVNGSANISWTMNEIMGSSDSSKFYRGDKTWNNTLVGPLTLSSSGSNRATLYLRTAADQPNDFYMGSNDTNKWSLSCRASNETYMLGMYSTDKSWTQKWFHTTGHVSFPYTVSIGTDTANGKLNVSGGLVNITANSNTVTIGSANTSYCHFQNSANIPFWFNKVVQSDGGFTIYNTGNNHWRNGYLQINKSDGGDCYLELLRASNADWRILNSGGNLYFQNNWTSAKGSYFNVLTLDYNTGRAHFKEYVYASYYNASCGAETPADGSYWIFANSDGFFRKSTRANASAKMDLDHRWVRVAGDTMTGALNFANNTQNKMGDDAYIGDQNIAGHIVIGGLNGASGIRLAAYGSNLAASIIANHTDGLTIRTESGNTWLYIGRDDASATKGIYFPGYGGGWYMSDTTYIRNYNSKHVYITGRLGVDCELRLWQNTRQMTRDGRSVAWINGRDSALVRESTSTGWHAVVSVKAASGSWNIGEYNTSGWANYLVFSYDTDSNYSAGTNSSTTIRFRNNGVVESAMWNDYAECRSTAIKEPGRVVYETKEKIMQLAHERLMPGCRIISDTFGFLIGTKENCDTPIAVSGRVLVYPYQDRENYILGAAVCSAPNGTVDIMTREEIMMYPERIIGTVSEIPDYETWEGGGVLTNDGQPIPVNGRIWIYVR